jgi:hypothetical protein
MVIGHLYVGGAKKRKKIDSQENKKHRHFYLILKPKFLVCIVKMYSKLFYLSLVCDFMWCLVHLIFCQILPEL